MNNTFDLIAFDADDTLWHNESLYHAGRERFEQIMAPYGLGNSFEARLDEIEIQNLPIYGYGAVGFVMSLIEAAIDLTSGMVQATDIQRILDLGKDMLQAEVQLFDHVEAVLQGLAASYPLMLITKGDLRHQQSKIARSGLKGHFRYIEIVSDKDPDTYATILERHGFHPERFLMVGNSLRSDILPVLELGGWAAYIPHELTWSHEHTELPATVAERFVELPSIHLLPGWIEGRTNGAPANGSLPAA